VFVDGFHGVIAHGFQLLPGLIEIETLAALQTETLRREPCGRGQALGEGGDAGDHQPAALR